MLKIIALGNRLRGDDAIGPRLLDELEKRGLPAGVRLIESGSDAFSILEHLMGETPVLILDSATLGKAPGSFVKFEVSKAALRKELDSISLHGFSFAEVYAMAGKMGPVAPCSVIAVQPQSTIFNQPISAELEQKIPLIIKFIEEETLKYAFSKNTHH